MTTRWLRGFLLGAGVAAAASAGCAHSQAAPEDGSRQAGAPAEKADSEVPEPAAQETSPSPHAERRGTERGMAPSRVYTHEELESTGERDVGRALRRLGHTPR